MELAKWWPRYLEIVRRLNLVIEEDQRAADILADLLKNRATQLSALRGLVAGKPVLVFGAGPSLARDLGKALDCGLHKVCTVIAADGAVSALLARDVVPDILVTDLDGNAEDILRASKLGALLVVHAHGDNIDRLLSLVPRIAGRVVGTTQVEPRENVYNFGGFTDGDRCAFMAEELGATVIALAGMDLGSLVGKYSKPWLSEDVVAWPVKRAKLEIARELLEWLASFARARLYNLTSSGTDIRGFKRIPAIELIDVLRSGD